MISILNVWHFKKKSNRQTNIRDIKRHTKHPLKQIIVNAITIAEMHTGWMGLGSKYKITPDQKLFIIIKM